MNTSIQELEQIIKECNLQIKLVKKQEIN